MTAGEGGEGTPSYNPRSAAVKCSPHAIYGSRFALTASGGSGRMIISAPLRGSMVPDDITFGWDQGRGVDQSKRRCGLLGTPFHPENTKSSQ